MQVKPKLGSLWILNEKKTGVNVMPRSFTPKSQGSSSLLLRIKRTARGHLQNANGYGHTVHDAWCMSLCSDVRRRPRAPTCVYYTQRIGAKVMKVTRILLCAYSFFRSKMVVIFSSLVSGYLSRYWIFFKILTRLSYSGASNCPE